MSTRESTVGVAIVGLGFGAAFLPIYQSHPDVRYVAIVDSDPARLADVGDRHGVDARYTDLDVALADPRIDAVHLLTPVAFHARQSIAVMAAGRDCACAVPMAMSLRDVDAVLAAQRASGRIYMMMETSVYGREFLTVQDMHRRGDVGAVTFYRGFHIQNLDGFPRYWLGYPPMAYVTHALSPILALLGTTVQDVRCLGSGRLTPDRIGDFDNPFPLEAAMFRLRGSDVVADVTMSFFQTARAYTEGFCVYGDRVSVEWPDQEGGPLTSHYLLAEPGRGRPVRREVFEPGDFGDRLPAPIAGFTRDHVYQPAAGRAPIGVPAHHGGSHPHLVHEFVRSVAERRDPAIDAATAANWTVPGILAHESALAGGAVVDVPDFQAVARRPI